MDERILAAVRGAEGACLSLRQLYREMGVPRKRQAEVRRAVRRLVQTGDLVRLKGKQRYGLPDGEHHVTGRIEWQRQGFAFLVPDRKGDPDVFVSRRNLGDATHGDRAVVEVIRRRDGGRPEGRVVRILEKADTRIVGRFVRGVRGDRLVPFDRKLKFELELTGKLDANSGMMVEAEITRYPQAGRPARGRIVEVLGYPTEPGVDTEVVIRHYGIRDEFPAQALREAENAPGTVPGGARRGRHDLRALTTVTIDGETARDFDDAISIEKTRGGYRLRVHIADVAHYVRAGSAIDLEAAERATSVYFPDRAVHMLPEALSKGICSLNPGEDRLALTVEMDLDSGGGPRRSRLYESVIRSDERMTYTNVRRILVDRDDAVLRRYAPLLDLFRLMEDLAALLHRRRVSRGSLDFDLPEPMLVLDEKGILTEVLPSERNVAHRIIEEFMILANETVAEHLHEAGLPALYRIHEDPDPSKIRDLAWFVSTFGLHLEIEDGRVRPRDLAKLLENVEGRPEERLIAQLTLRSLSRARYSPEPTGHFGLASDLYLHFTSPIRRYPDLFVHRVLKEKLRRERVKNPGRAFWQAEGFDEDLDALADHCSRRERIADEAERDLVEWKQVAFMTRHVGAEFDGRITGVMRFGIFVELERFFVEGLVHVSTLTDDRFEFDEARHRLLGERTSRVLRLGDRVKVQVERADLVHRRLDFLLVSHTPSVPERPRRAGPGGGRSSRKKGGGRPSGERDRRKQRKRRRR